MQRSKAGSLAALALLAAWSGCALAGSWSYGAQAGVEYDSNVANAGTDGDERSTERIDAGVDAAYARPFGLFTALQLRAGLEATADLEFDKLSFARVSARVRVLHKPGAGFYVPVLAAWGSAGLREGGSSIRDGSDWRGGVYLIEPLTTAVQARLEAQLSRREASGRAFDLDERAVAASLDWAVAPWLTLYGGYRVSRGGLVISAEGGGVTPKSEHQYLELYAEAIEPDDAFGEDWNAFRVEARTQVASLGLNVPLTGDLSLDAQLRRAHAEADLGDGSIYGFAGGLAYDRWLGTISRLMRL